MKTETKHTPGPWRVLDNAILSTGLNKFGNFFVAGLPAREEHAVNEPNLKAILAENQANAHLIAAAPDMLEALKRITLMLNDDHEACHLCDRDEDEGHDPESACGQALKAIAKAEPKP